MFLAPKIFQGGGPPSCPSLAGDCHQFAIMWQSFAAMGRGTSEIWMSKEKKTSAAEQKPVRRPKMSDVMKFST